MKHLGKHQLLYGLQLEVACFVQKLCQTCTDIAQMVSYSCASSYPILACDQWPWPHRIPILTPYSAQLH